MRSIYSFIIIIVFISCSNKQKQEELYQVKLINSYNLPVPEPSGLALTFNEDGFWTVSDENSTVYKFDKYGKVIKKFKVEGIDLEGITVVDEKTIAVVLERSREVVVLDTSGIELRRKKLNLRGDDNLGLEGIAFNRKDSVFYVLNEKKPGLLIQLDFDLNELRRDTLTFAKDYSGVCYSEDDNFLWIVSDESKFIAQTDLRGTIIEKFKIDVIQAEGICVDQAGRRIYIVSDKEEKLYVYEFNSEPGE